jgi:hypothetical protein
MTGADRQWQLNRQNFEGRWCGTSHWYLRGEAGPEEEGALDLGRPSRQISDTCYAISFRDADHGLWDGSGLLFAPGGRRQLEISRSTYNRSGACWQFVGAGGQSSLRIDPEQPRWGHEINFFQGRSRSMLVLLWGRRDGDHQAPIQTAPGVQPPRPAGGAGGGWRLDSLAAVAFRCALSAPPDPPRAQLPVAQELLEQQRGWPGVQEVLVAGEWPADPPPAQPCGGFQPERFVQRGGLTAGFADGLVCSVPEWLPQGAFRLEVGCRVGAAMFQQLSLRIDAAGRLLQWQRRCFQRDG